jgi:hypothetical protein
LHRQALLGIPGLHPGWGVLARLEEGHILCLLVTWLIVAMLCGLICFSAQ